MGLDYKFSLNSGLASAICNQTWHPNLNRDFSMSLPHHEYSSGNNFKVNQNTYSKISFSIIIGTC